MPDAFTASTWATPTPIDWDETFTVPARSCGQTWILTLDLPRIRERRETRRWNAEYRHRMYGEPLPQVDTRAWPMPDAHEDQ